MKFTRLKFPDILIFQSSVRPRKHFLCNVFQHGCTLNWLKTFQHRGGFLLLLIIWPDVVLCCCSHSLSGPFFLYTFPLFSRKAITGIEKGLDFFLHSTVLTAVTGPVQPAHPFTCVFRLLWVIWSFDPFWHFLMPKLTFHRVALLLCDWQADLLLSAWIFSSCFSCWYFSAQSSDLQQFSILCSAPFCPSESPAISGHTPSVFPLLPVLVSFPDLL